jgi:para-nitrobenzyl esterase
MKGTTRTVRTRSGTIEGTCNDGVSSFLGVPYAQAPVGPLRFAAPHPPKPWSEPLRALAFGPAVPQPKADPAAPFDVIQLLTGSPRLAQSEDNCLTLNVWAPTSESRPRPVLLWLHGSGWLSGTSGWAGHDAAKLALEEDLVVVTANFRLGALGFLALPNVAEGNMGFLDALAALRWVAENVAEFGGDPTRITVGGQSGGGVISVALMAYPPARGLFRRVFSQSAPLGIPMLTTAQAHAAGRSYLLTVGLRPGEKDNEQRLCDMDADELAAGYLRLIRTQNRRQVGSPAPPLHLTAGLSGLPEAVFDALRDGEGSDVDLLIGSTGEEFNPFLALETRTEPVPRHIVSAMLSREEPPVDGGAVYEHYARRRPGAAPLQVMADVRTDMLVRLPALRLAELRADQARPTWVYQVDWRSRFGACHMVDVPFLFNTLPAWAGSPMFHGCDVAEAEQVGAAFRTSVAAFVRGGDPNNTEVPIWHPYSKPDRRTMRFDTLTYAVDDLAGAERRFQAASGLVTEM